MSGFELFIFLALASVLSFEVVFFWVFSPRGFSSKNPEANVNFIYLFPFVFNLFPFAVC